MGTLFQALEIIFDVQRKRNYEKTTRREISFFPFFSWTPPTLDLVTFLFLIHLKQF
jgi:hypothetical protein